MSGLTTVLNDKHKLQSSQIGVPLRELQGSLRGSALGHSKKKKKRHFLFLQIKNI